MRCIGLGVCVLMLVGCSNEEVRSGAQELVASATADDLVGAQGEPAGAQPTVLFRCENGRIGAYVVTGDFEDQPTEDQMVPISLDSAPGC